MVKAGFLSKKIIFLLIVIISLCVLFHKQGLWSFLVNSKNEAAPRDYSADQGEHLGIEIAGQKTNGDLERYHDKRGSYSKGLDHYSNGNVKLASFNSLINALKSGESSDFNAVILGGDRELVEPKLACDVVRSGNDMAIFAMPAPPELTSAETAADMVELYWGTLLRDVPFNQYGTNSIAAAAITDLNAMSNFKGPKQDGVVTPQTLWRGNTPGDLKGPYISQFLYQPIPVDGKENQQSYISYIPGYANNFLTNLSDFLSVRSGGSTGLSPINKKTPNYIVTGRDLGAYDHIDNITETTVTNAALILREYGQAALKQNNSYQGDSIQEAFVSYGWPKMLEILKKACATAYKAAWCQKWLAHLRLRPEDFGFLVHKQIINRESLHLHRDVIHSPVLAKIFSIYGTYLLPQMYSEGCPTHPSFPAGHSVIVGAGATVVKAFFNENFAIPNPLQPNSDNTDLVPYIGTLYVGDELNKLASNIGLGRDFAGVHFRVDSIEGLKLGEKIALTILEAEEFADNENFIGHTITKFNGKTKIIGKKGNKIKNDFHKQDQNSQ